MSFIDQDHVTAVRGGQSARASHVHYKLKARPDGQLRMSMWLTNANWNKLEYNCVKCDAKLESAFAKCPACGHEDEKCPACSRILYERFDDEGKRYCPRCGSHI